MVKKTIARVPFQRLHPLGGSPKERADKEKARKRIRQEAHAAALKEFQARGETLLKAIDSSTTAKTTKHHAEARKKLTDLVVSAKKLAAAQV